MTERRVLLALLLLALTAALYIWARPPGSKKPDTPVPPEVKERTSANPFPA